MNPNLDSLANRMVGVVGSDVIVFRLRIDNLLFTSGFASESTSKLDSLDSRIRIRVRALNGQIH